MKEGFRRAGQRASQDHNMAPCQIAPSSGPLPPQSLEVISRSSPSDLTIAWGPAPGQLEGYKVTWHEDGSQRSPGDPVDLGPDTLSLTLKSLVPGSCYTVSAWAWAGNLSSDSQKIHSCTRESLTCPQETAQHRAWGLCVFYSLLFSVVRVKIEVFPESSTFYIPPCGWLAMPTHLCDLHPPTHPCIPLSVYPSLRTSI